MLLLLIKTHLPENIPRCKLVKLSYTEGRAQGIETSFSGVANGNTWNGSGRDAMGNTFTWTATFDKLQRQSQTVPGTAAYATG